MLRQVFATFFSSFCFVNLLFCIFWAIPANSPEGYLHSTSGYSSSLSGIDYEHLRSELGLSNTFFKSLSIFYSQLQDGSWGLSFSQGREVRPIIFSKVSTTFSYLVPSLILLFPCSLLIVFLQHFSSLPLMNILSFLNHILLCLPIFVLAASWFWLFNHLSSHTSLVFLSLLAALPTFCFLIGKRVSQELSMTYIQAVRAKGLSFTRLFYRHLFKTCFWVFLSLIPWWWSISLGSAIILEPLFRVPGLGLLSMESFRNQDVPVLLGLTLFWGLARIWLGLFRDLLFKITAQDRMRLITK